MYEGELDSEGLLPQRVRRQTDGVVVYVVEEDKVLLQGSNHGGTMSTGK